MSILGIQIVGLLFALFMFYLTFLHQRRREFTTKEYLFWALSWTVFILLVLFPTSLDFFIKGVLNVDKRLDFFLIVGIMFLIGMVFHIYIIVRKTQNKVQKVVRKIAFDMQKKK